MEPGTGLPDRAGERWRCQFFQIERLPDEHERLGVESRLWIADVPAAVWLLSRWFRFGLLQPRLGMAVLQFGQLSESERLFGQPWRLRGQPGAGMVRVG